MLANKIGLVWQILLRLIVGFYWIYFSSQRWFSPFGVKNTLITAATGNYLPVYGDVLRSIVAADWQNLMISVTVLESVVGFMILLGLLTRVAAAVGALHALNLTLTFTFCNCPWAEADFQLTFWFYFAPLLLNVQVAFDQSSNLVGVQRLVTRLRQSMK